MFSAEQLELLKKTAEELKARSSAPPSAGSDLAKPLASAAPSLVPYGEDDVSDEVMKCTRVSASRLAKVAYGR